MVGVKQSFLPQLPVFLTELDYDDPRWKDEAKDFRFVKWLMKEKVCALL